VERSPRAGAKGVDVATLATKLAEVRASGKKCVGSEAHKFELAPTASLEDVEAFERARKLTLPEGYRRFVLEVGASGAGPFNGLMPLARWEEGLRVARKLKIPAITLTDQGCNNYSLLVIDGPRRGRIAYVTDTSTATSLSRLTPSLSPRNKPSLGPSRAPPPAAVVTTWALVGAPLGARCRRSRPRGRPGGAR
jgi:hypothetical protein